MSVLVISEIGVNHNGSVDTAKYLIDAAQSSGADVVKFQLFKPELFPAEKQQMLRELHLSEAKIAELYRFCEQQKMPFSCTAFDVESLRWLLENTTMQFVKISSGLWNNHELLKLAANCGLPVIQSIASQEHMCSLPAENWRYLHVVPEYPTPAEHANLSMLKRRYINGLSDHSGNIYLPLAAVAMGAQIIECHITTSHHEKGPDHMASLEQRQFEYLVEGIRSIEKALQ